MVHDKCSALKKCNLFNDRGHRLLSKSCQSGCPGRSADFLSVFRNTRKYSITGSSSSSSLSAKCMDVKVRVDYGRDERCVGFLIADELLKMKARKVVIPGMDEREGAEAADDPNKWHGPGVDFYRIDVINPFQSTTTIYADDYLLIAATAVIIVDQNYEAKKSRKRRFWVRPSLKSGRAKCSVNDFMNDLISEQVDKLNLEYRCGTGFRNFFRMTSNDFETLLSLIGPRIIKMNNTFRKAIPVNERLAVTLRFLATGDSYHSLMHIFKISK
ncbi:hypothetical protein QTP88_003659 [Uroleucon formosanum]